MPDERDRRTHGDRGAAVKEKANRRRAVDEMVTGCLDTGEHVDEGGREPGKRAFRDQKHDRERYETAGLGQGDAYRGMWAYLHDSLRHCGPKPMSAAIRLEYATTLYRILPFEAGRPGCALIVFIPL
jgi:hypothetical protein